MQTRRATVSHGMTLKSLCTLCILAPWILASAQDKQSGFTLEALCSANGAAVRWTVHDEEVAEICDIHYICRARDTDTNMAWTRDNDACFSRSTDKCVSLSTSAQHMSMTHIVGRKLPVGTVCTFSARSEDDYDPLGNEVTNCTVKEPMLLPASCDVFNNSGGGEECQCTCSPGFTGAPNTFAGTTCEAINVTNEKENVNTSSPEIIVTSTLSMLEVSMTPTSTSTILSSNNGFTIQTGTFPLASTRSTVTGSLNSTPTPVIRDNSNAPTTNLIVALTLSLLLMMVVFISLGLTCTIIIYRKKKLRKLHDKLAMPFEVLKFERIDPDFNPIDISSKVIFLTESMPSIFNEFGSGGETFELISEDKRDFDSQSTVTEKNFLAESRESIELSETEEQEVILSDNEQGTIHSTMDTSSGYVTNSIVSSHLYEQTKDYIIEALNISQEPTSFYHASTSTPNAEAEPSNCIDEGRIVTTIDNDEQCRNVWNVKSKYVLEPVDYILPTLGMPQVFFSFPKELTCDH